MIYTFHRALNVLVMGLSRQQTLLSSTANRRDLPLQHKQIACGSTSAEMMPTVLSAPLFCRFHPRFQFNVDILLQTHDGSLRVTVFRTGSTCRRPHPVFLSIQLSIPCILQKDRMLRRGGGFLLSLSNTMSSPAPVRRTCPP